MSVTITNNGTGASILTIDRPPVNALDEKQVDKLSSAFEKVINNPEIRVIILTGAGKIFVAGADMDKLLAADEDQACEMSEGVKALHHQMRQSSKPIIAAINGVAAGGGLELAMACDMRIADTKAVMGLPEVTLGVLPGAGGTQLLPRLIGIGRAMKLMFEGGMISAQAALEYGLVDQLSEKESVVETALKTAEKICQNAPLAIAQIKAAAWDTLSMPLYDGLKMETRRFGRLCNSQDKNEGILAFKERRKAKFSSK